MSLTTDRRRDGVKRMREGSTSHHQPLLRGKVSFDFKPHDDCLRCQRGGLLKCTALCLNLYLIHYFDQRPVYIIDQVELWSPQQVTHLPPVWDISLQRS